MSWLRAIAVSAMFPWLSLGASPASASSFRTVDIMARDGVVLTGNVFTPDTSGLPPGHHLHHQLGHAQRRVPRPGPAVRR